MKTTQKHKAIISSLLLGVYLFVAFFAINLHNHGSSEVFKEFHFLKTEKSLSKTTNEAAFVDCLSCHLFHEGKSLLPNQIPAIFIHFEIVNPSFPSLQHNFYPSALQILQLRGPPSFI